MDWLLNSSIEKSFTAFKSGFDIVMGESHLADLFTAEEVELLVCGSNVSGEREGCGVWPYSSDVWSPGMGLGCTGAQYTL